jgi:glyoxylate/hydroxypyruvate reductase A
MLNVLYAGRPEGWAAYRPALETAFAEEGLEVALSRDHPPAEVDYIVHAPNGPLRDFTPFVRARAVLSLWAGVESIVDEPSLRIPLTRMIDEGLSEGMVEWVAGHVLRHHLGMDRHILGQDGIWRGQEVPPLARDRQVAVLGLGALGRAVAQALAALRFRVSGWSRTPHRIDGLDTAHGPEGLAEVLARAEILVLLLPATSATANLLDADRLALLPRGAVVLNPGRGSLIDEAALLAALDRGQVGHATLDVFRTEPLPPGHPFWAHPKVTVTPHIAAATRPASAARVIARNVRRDRDGLPLLYLVNRAQGY